MRVPKSSNPAASGKQYRLAQAVLSGTVRERTGMTKQAAREIVEKTPAKARSRYARGENPAKKVLRRRANSASSAESLHATFHGMPPTETIEFSERRHAHEHLTGLGLLYGLKVRVVSGIGDVPILFETAQEQKRSANPKAQRTLTLKSDLHFVRTDNRDGLKTLRSGQKVKVSWDSYLGRGAAYLHEFGTDWQSIIPPDEGQRVFKNWPADWTDWRAANPSLFSRVKKHVLGGPQPLEHEKYKGYRLYKTYSMDDADYVYMVPQIDPGSRFDDRAQAKRFIDHWVKKNPKRKKKNPEEAIQYEGPAYLASNEKGTQLFIVGGDQSLDLKALKIEGAEAEKENVVIGEAWLVCYRATKDYHEGNGPEENDWVHGLGDEKARPRVRKGEDLWEDAQAPEKLFGTGELPTVVYRRLDQRIDLAGGVYYIEKPLMGTSAGLVD